MIYIVADDLTGANDTGAQFAKKGYRTIVLILEDRLPEMFFTDNYDVVVLDTETRNVDEKTARNRLNKILEGLHFSKEDIVYKKIDSTLRGNIGGEIEEIMKIFGKKVCILSPSFPSHQRATLGGYLLMQKKLIEHSAFNENLYGKKKDSYIPSVLAKQTNLQIGHIDISDVEKGQPAILNRISELVKEKKQIIIVDSNNDENLQDIVSGGLKYRDSVLFSGSAGLANYLAKSHKHKYPIIEQKSEKSPVLIIGGSRNPVMVSQIEYIKNNMNFNEIKIDISQIFKHKNQLILDYGYESLKILKNNKNLIIYTNAIENEEKSINNKIMQKYKISYRDLENSIKEAFGTLAAYLVNGSNVRNLILTGGDIALSVCKELDICKLQILDELLPGIPLARASYKKQNLNIVTKAGGFGQEDALYKLINKFQNYFESTTTGENIRED